MATSISYGMGQYRYNMNYNYIVSPSKIIEPSDISYYKTNYQDIQVKLPMLSTQSNVSTPFVQYGSTYYMRLTVPQNNQYDTTLNLKLCPGDPNQENSIDASRFQEIKKIFVPKTLENDDVYSDVILFEAPTKGSNGKIKWDTGIIKANIWDKTRNAIKAGITTFSTHQPQNLYYEAGEYRYYYGSGTNEYYLMTDNFYEGQMPQTWKMKDSSPSTITIDFVFSPKYNLTGGYSYLLIETDRTDAYHQSIQYFDDDDKDKSVYYGTRLNKESIEIELYGVTNLLELSNSGISQIQSGSTSLSHIAVWGHPGQLLAVNGEEIRIGQSGFYELGNFTINQLGVIVYDKEVDRFTIDYEYKILNS